MLELRPWLESWVEDDAVWFRNRMHALDVWAKIGALDTTKARSWLEQFRQGSLKDLDARLSSELLFSLYPDHVGPEEVFRYWPEEGEIDRFTVWPRSWSVEHFDWPPGIAAYLIAVRTIGRLPDCVWPPHHDC